MEKIKKDEYEIRREKLNKLSDQMVVYKDKYEVTEKLENIKKLEEGVHVKIAGRIISKRSFGKFMFINLYDINGRSWLRRVLLRHNVQWYYDKK